MALVIGSLAAHVQAPRRWSRFNDIDLVMFADEREEWTNVGKWTIFGHSELGTTYVGYPMGRSGKIVEISTVERNSGGSTADMLWELEARADLRTVRILDQDVPCAPLEWLYALKRSHLYKRDSPHFDKTMRDVHDLRDLVDDHVSFDARLRLPLPDGDLGEWTRKRCKETYAEQHHPNLNVKKKDFFSDAHGVHYTWDHDTIHLAMSRDGMPAYELYKDDLSEVKCSKEKFWSIRQEDRLAGVLEESYVLALERSQVPHPGACTPRESFLMALKGVCTRITSGWFREFAAGHYYEVLELYSDTYVDRLQEGIASGLVKPAS